MYTLCNKFAVPTSSIYMQYRYEMSPGVNINNREVRRLVKRIRVRVRVKIWARVSFGGKSDRVSALRFTSQKAVTRVTKRVAKRVACWKKKTVAFFPLCQCTCCEFKHLFPGPYVSQTVKHGL